MGKVGRPRKADLYKGRIRAAEDIIADRLPDLIQNLLSLACGVWIEEEDEDGVKRVYQRPPCRQSNEYLINRVMGKVPDKGPADESDLDDAEPNDSDGNTIDP
jgi:hypothetical protein